MPKQKIIINWDLTHLLSFQMQCTSYTDVLHYLKLGLARRNSKTLDTHLSSLSHAVFTFHIYKLSNGQLTKHNKLIFIDLTSNESENLIEESIHSYNEYYNSSYQIIYDVIANKYPFIVPNYFTAIHKFLQDAFNANLVKPVRGKNQLDFVPNNMRTIVLCCISNEPAFANDVSNCVSLLSYIYSLYQAGTPPGGEQINKEVFINYLRNRQMTSVPMGVGRENGGIGPENGLWNVGNPQGNLENGTRIIQNGMVQNEPGMIGNGIVNVGNTLGNIENEPGNLCTLNNVGQGNIGNGPRIIENPTGNVDGFQGNARNGITNCSGGLGTVEMENGLLNDRLMNNNGSANINTNISLLNHPISGHYVNTNNFLNHDNHMGNVFNHSSNFSRNNFNICGNRDIFNMMYIDSHTDNPSQYIGNEMGNVNTGLRNMSIEFAPQNVLNSQVDPFLAEQIRAKNALPSDFVRANKPATGSPCERKVNAIETRKRSACRPSLCKIDEETDDEESSDGKSSVESGSESDRSPGSSDAYNSSLASDSNCEDLHDEEDENGDKELNLHRTNEENGNAIDEANSDGTYKDKVTEEKIRIDGKNSPIDEANRDGNHKDNNANEDVEDQEEEVDPKMDNGKSESDKIGNELEPHLVKVQDHTDKIEPKLDKRPSQLDRVDPKLTQDGSGKKEPKPDKVGPQRNELELKADKMGPKRNKLVPSLAPIKPNLAPIEPNLTPIAPNLTKVRDQIGIEFTENNTSGVWSANVIQGISELTEDEASSDLSDSELDDTRSIPTSEVGSEELALIEEENLLEEEQNHLLEQEQIEDHNKEQQQDQFLHEQNQLIQQQEKYQYKEQQNKFIHDQCREQPNQLMEDSRRKRGAFVKMPPTQVTGLNGQLTMPNGQLIGLNGQIIGPGPNGQVIGSSGQLISPNNQLMGPNGPLMGPNGLLMGLNMLAEPNTQQAQPNMHLGNPPISRHLFPNNHVPMSYYFGPNNFNNFPTMAHSVRNNVHTMINQQNNAINHLVPNLHPLENNLIVRPKNDPENRISDENRKDMIDPKNSDERRMAEMKDGERGGEEDEQSNLNKTLDETDCEEEGDEEEEDHVNQLLNETELDRIYERLNEKIEAINDTYLRKVFKGIHDSSQTVQRHSQSIGSQKSCDSIERHGQAIGSPSSNRSLESVRISSQSFERHSNQPIGSPQSNQSVESFQKSSQISERYQRSGQNHQIESNKTIDSHCINDRTIGSSPNTNQINSYQGNQTIGHNLLGAYLNDNLVVQRLTDFQQPRTGDNLGPNTNVNNLNQSLNNQTNMNSLNQSTVNQYSNVNHHLNVQNRCANNLPQSNMNSQPYVNNQMYPNINNLNPNVHKQNLNVNQTHKVSHQIYSDVTCLPPSNVNTPQAPSVFKDNPAIGAQRTEHYSPFSHLDTSGSPVNSQKPGGGFGCDARSPVSIPPNWNQGFPGQASPNFPGQGLVPGVESLQAAPFQMNTSAFQAFIAHNYFASFMHRAGGLSPAIPMVPLTGQPSYETGEAKPQSPLSNPSQGSRGSRFSATESPLTSQSFNASPSGTPECRDKKTRRHRKEPKGRDSRRSKERKIRNGPAHETGTRNVQKGTDGNDELRRESGQSQLKQCLNECDNCAKIVKNCMENREGNLDLRGDIEVDGHNCLNTTRGTVEDERLNKINSINHKLALTELTPKSAALNACTLIEPDMANLAVNIAHLTLNDQVNHIAGLKDGVEPLQGVPKDILDRVSSLNEAPDGMANREHPHLDGNRVSNTVPSEALPDLESLVSSYEFQNVWNEIDMKKSKMNIILLDLDTASKLINELKQLINLKNNLLTFLVNNKPLRRDVRAKIRLETGSLKIKRESLEHDLCELKRMQEKLNLQKLNMKFKKNRQGDANKQLILFNHLNRMKTDDEPSGNPKRVRKHSRKLVEVGDDEDAFAKRHTRALVDKPSVPAESLSALVNQYAYDHRLIPEGEPESPRDDPMSSNDNTLSTNIDTLWAQIGTTEAKLHTLEEIGKITIKSDEHIEELNKNLGRWTKILGKFEKRIDDEKAKKEQMKNDLVLNLYKIKSIEETFNRERHKSEVLADINSLINKLKPGYLADTLGREKDATESDKTVKPDGNDSSSNATLSKTSDIKVDAQPESSERGCETAKSNASCTSKDVRTTHNANEGNNECSLTTSPKESKKSVSREQPSLVSEIVNQNTVTTIFTPNVTILTKDPETVANKSTNPDTLCLSDPKQTGPNRTETSSQTDDNTPNLPSTANGAPDKPNGSPQGLTPQGTTPLVESPHGNTNKQTNKKCDVIETLMNGSDKKLDNLLETESSIDTLGSVSMRNYKISNSTEISETALSVAAVSDKSGAATSVGEKPRKKKSSLSRAFSFRKSHNVTASGCPSTERSSEKPAEKERSTTSKKIKNFILNKSGDKNKSTDSVRTKKPDDQLSNCSNQSVRGANNPATGGANDKLSNSSLVARLKNAGKGGDDRKTDPVGTSASQSGTNGHCEQSTRNQDVCRQERNPKAKHDEASSQNQENVHDQTNESSNDTNAEASNVKVKQDALQRKIAELREQKQVIVEKRMKLFPNKCRDHTKSELARKLFYEYEEAIETIDELIEYKANAIWELGNGSDNSRSNGNTNSGPNAAYDTNSRLANIGSKANPNSGSNTGGYANDEHGGQSSKGSYLENNHVKNTPDQCTTKLNNQYITNVGETCHNKHCNMSEPSQNSELGINPSLQNSYINQVQMGNPNDHAQLNSPTLEHFNTSSGTQIGPNGYSSNTTFGHTHTNNHDQYLGNSTNHFLGNTNQTFAQPLGVQSFTHQLSASKQPVIKQTLSSDNSSFSTVNQAGINYCTPKASDGFNASQKGVENTRPINDLYRTLLARLDARELALVVTKYFHRIVDLRNTTTELDKLVQSLDFKLETKLGALQELELKYELALQERKISNEKALTLVEKEYENRLHWFYRCYCSEPASDPVPCDNAFLLREKNKHLKRRVRYLEAELREAAYQLVPAGGAVVERANQFGDLGREMGLNKTITVENKKLVISTRK